MPLTTPTAPRRTEQLRLILVRRAELLRIESAISLASERIAAGYCRSAER